MTKTYLIDDKDDLEMVKEEYDEIIMNISEDIMVDNIKDQIHESNTKQFYTDQHHKNFFEYFEIRFNFVLERYKDDNDILNRTKEVYNDILNEILESIQDTYQLSIEFSEDILVEDKAQYIKSLYYFFVLNKKEMINNLFINYIEKNIVHLSKTYEDNLNDDINTSLSYNNLKKTIDNEYTAMIYSIPDIIEGIYIGDNEDIIETIILDEESELNNYQIDKMLVEQSITDVRFDNNLINVLRETFEDNNVLFREIQYYFINKYK
ncbi:hypothetical protein CPT_Machias_074 [Staphylococcus phage Machias]|nr:hypothetical protein CPT_Machias_074 [Staphylococcus phage Machias]